MEQDYEPAAKAAYSAMGRRFPVYGRNWEGEIPEMRQAWIAAISSAADAATLAERARATEIIKRRLMPSNQSAMTWHDCHDAMKEVYNGPIEAPTLKATAERERLCKQLAAIRRTP